MASERQGTRGADEGSSQRASCRRERPLNINPTNRIRLHERLSGARRASPRGAHQVLRRAQIRRPAKGAGRGTSGRGGTATYRTADHVADRAGPDSAGQQHQRPDRRATALHDVRRHALPPTSRSSRPGARAAGPTAQATPPRNTACWARSSWRWKNARRPLACATTCRRARR